MRWPALPSVPLARPFLLWLQRSMGRCKPDQPLVKLVVISVVNGPCQPQGRKNNLGGAWALSALGQNKAVRSWKDQEGKVVISGRESPLVPLFWGGNLSSASSTGFPLQLTREDSASLKSWRGGMWVTSPAIIPSFEKLLRLKKQSVSKLYAKGFSLKRLVGRVAERSVLDLGIGQSSYAPAPSSSEQLRAGSS